MGIFEGRKNETNDEWRCLGEKLIPDLKGLVGW